MEQSDRYSDRLRKSDYHVRNVGYKLATSIIEKYHYTKGCSSVYVYVHGLFNNNNPNECLGVAWWLPPTKGAGLRLTKNWDKVLSLSRLVVLPDQPKNAASFLMAQSFKIIRKSAAWEKLVTYADTRQGHTGGIYRATNWEYDGMTVKTPTWVDKNGRTISRKAGKHTRTALEMSDLGYELVGHYSKLRFVIDLGPCAATTIRPTYEETQTNLFCGIE